MAAAPQQRSLNLAWLVWQAIGMTQRARFLLLFARSKSAPEAAASAAAPKPKTVLESPQPPRQRPPQPGAMQHRTTATSSDAINFIMEGSATQLAGSGAAGEAKESDKGNDGEGKEAVQEDPDAATSASDGAEGGQVLVDATILRLCAAVWRRDVRSYSRLCGTRCLLELIRSESRKANSQQLLTALLLPLRDALREARSAEGDLVPRAASPMPTPAVAGVDDDRAAGGAARLTQQADDKTASGVDASPSAVKAYAEATNPDPLPWITEYHGWLTALAGASTVAIAAIQDEQANLTRLLGRVGADATQGLHVNLAQVVLWCLAVDMRAPSIHQALAESTLMGPLAEHAQLEHAAKAVMTRYTEDTSDQPCCPADLVLEQQAVDIDEAPLGLSFVKAPNQEAWLVSAIGLPALFKHVSVGDILQSVDGVNLQAADTTALRAALQAAHRKLRSGMTHTATHSARCCLVCIPV